jgi:hypothetical protein
MTGFRRSERDRPGCRTLWLITVIASLARLPSQIGYLRRFFPGEFARRATANPLTCQSRQFQAAF